MTFTAHRQGILKRLTIRGRISRPAGRDNQQSIPVSEASRATARKSAVSAN